jgi:uncharacterized protein
LLVFKLALDAIRPYLLGIPAMVSRLWVGFKLYGKLDDVAFPKAILILLYL